MIQATGIILIGMAEYTDPLLNVYMNSASKFDKTLGIAQIGFICEETEELKKEFISIQNVCTFQYNLINPSFEELQDLVLISLENLYPLVKFEIVK